MKKYSVGLLGAGVQGIHQARRILSHSRLNLETVFEREPHSALSDLGVHVETGDFQETLRNYNHDLLVCALPDKLHPEFLDAAIDLPTLLNAIEKPSSHSRKATIEMARKAQRNQDKFTVAYLLLGSTPVTAAKKLIDSGQFIPDHVEWTWSKMRDDPVNGNGNREHTGALLTEGVHPIGILDYLMPLSDRLVHAYALPSYVQNGQAEFYSTGYKTKFRDNEVAVIGKVSFHGYTDKRQITIQGHLPSGEERTLFLAFDRPYHIDNTSLRREQVPLSPLGRFEFLAYGVPQKSPEATKWFGFPDLDNPDISEIERRIGARSLAKAGDANPQHADNLSRQLDAYVATMDGRPINYKLPTILSSLRSEGLVHSLSDLASSDTPEIKTITLDTQFP